MEDILSLSAFGVITDQELEDCVFIHDMNVRKAPENRRERYGTFEIEDLSDRECYALFRFNKNDIGRLVELLNIPEVISTNNRYSVSGTVGLCILLRRLCYPNRLFDIEPLFGLSSPYLSAISNHIMRIVFENKGYLLNDLRNLQWLTEERLQVYAKSLIDKGSPIHNCWGFIDGTPRAICRPSIDQQEYFSGHKRYHCLKYQSVVCPDGIITSLLGPFKGARHDAGILRETNLYNQLIEKVKFNDENKYVLYGDPAYPIRELLICPFSSRNLTNEQLMFNKSMSPLRQGVEWAFGKIVNEFAFLDFKKNQKLLLQDLGKMYKVGALLTNCHTCIYGSQCSMYFDVEPVSLEQYLL
jgi:hypothetical protein